MQAVDFKILQSSIKVPYHCEILDCAVQLTGVTSEEKLSAFFIDKSYYTSFVYIKNTTFQGAYGPFFTITNTDLHIFNSVFHLQSHRTSTTHLIDFQGFLHDGFPEDGYIFKDTLITLTSIDREVLRINIMSVMTSFAEFQNTQIVCPLGMNAVEIVPSKKEPYVYHCEAICTSNMYTFQSGNISLNQKSEF